VIAPSAILAVVMAHPGRCWLEGVGDGGGTLTRGDGRIGPDFDFEVGVAVENVGGDGIAVAEQGGERPFLTSTGFITWNHFSVPPLTADQSEKRIE